MQNAERGAIVDTWLFASETSSRAYQTLRYADGSTSCDCPGWTKRLPAGGRTCKHTRLVSMGEADKHAIAQEHASIEARINRKMADMVQAINNLKRTTINTEAPARVGRGFSFED